MRAGRTEKAMALLTRIAKENGKAMPQGKMITYLQVKSQIFGSMCSEKGDVCTVQCFITDIHEYTLYFIFLISQNDRGRVKDLFTPQYWRTTLLLLYIWLA